MERTKSYIFTTDPQLNVLLQELIDYGSSFLINRAMDMAITTLLSGNFNPRLHDEIVKVIQDANVLSLTENSLEEIVETVVELISHLFNRYYRSFENSFIHEILYVEGVSLIYNGLVIRVRELLH